MRKLYKLGRWADLAMMMLGSRMTMDVDAGDGRAIGSRIRIQGRTLGIALSLEEAIIERRVPVGKVWETLGTPKLLIIAHYRMGLELTPEGDASRVRVFIDYSLPATGPSVWLGRLYARWCTRRMAEDAARQFMRGGGQLRPA